MKRVGSHMAKATGVALLIGFAVAWPVWGAEEAAEPAPLPTPAEVEAAIKRGVDFLLENQNKDGSWGSPTQTKGLNIYAPVPGSHHAFRTAVTAMAIEAILETKFAAEREDVRTALKRAESWFLENIPKVRRADPTAIYNVWTHAYGIQALVAMYRERPKNSEERTNLVELIRGQIDMLRKYESVDGGWGYYDFEVGAKRPATSSTSFVTATVLVAFHRAKGIGVEIPEDMRARALASISRQRKADNTYVYGEYLKMRPMMGVNRPGGSLGRSQACNLALRYWGDETITEDVIREWLERLIKRNGWLSIGRKRPVPHEAWFQVAGYFFYYGHYYAALNIQELKGPEANGYRDRLAGLIMALQEKDGSWWDFPFYAYHQPYGTSFALMTLLRCRHPQ